jgi:hypothetical protein
MRPLLLAAVLAALAAAPAARADCCSYAGPELGALVADGDSALVAVASTQPDPGEDVTVGRVLRLRDGAAPEQVGDDLAALPAFGLLPDGEVRAFVPEGPRAGLRTAVAPDGSVLLAAARDGELVVRREDGTPLVAAQDVRRVLDVVADGDGAAVLYEDRRRALHLLRGDDSTLLARPLPGGRRASGALGPGVVAYLAQATARRPDAILRTLGPRGLGTPRRLTRTRAAETAVLGVAGPRALVLRGGQALLIGIGGGTTRLGPAAPGAAPQGALAASPELETVVWEAPGPREARTCGRLVARTLQGGTLGPVRRLADCGVGNS